MADPNGALKQTSGPSAFARTACECIVGDMRWIVERRLLAALTVCRPSQVLGYHCAPR